MNTWKKFLDKLPINISEKIMEHVFEDVPKIKKESLEEFKSIKYFIEFLIKGIN